MYLKYVNNLSNDDLNYQIMNLKIELQKKNAEVKEDYEEIEVLKKHKIHQHEKILRQAIDSKYKISLSKGFQLVYESLCLLVLLISIIMKANIFSLIYLSFIFKYVMSRGKTDLLVRMTTYIAICISIQYLLFMLNLTHETSPSPYPEFLRGYPLREKWSKEKNSYVQVTDEFHYNYHVS